MYVADCLIYSYLLSDSAIFHCQLKRLYFFIFCKFRSANFQTYEHTQKPILRDYIIVTMRVNVRSARMMVMPMMYETTINKGRFVHFRKQRPPILGF